MADHAHPHHDHDHGHGHDHHHDADDTYFIDQLCMVGLSGAFGVICLCLYFWQTRMLQNMLGEQFFLFVLLSGIGLTTLAFVRAAILWRQSRNPHFRHGHDHAHEHAVQAAPAHLHSLQTVPAHEHEHGAACGHTHAPGEACGHDHAHEHAAAVPHQHAHHDHDEADHDHGWAPWRYVVILVPIILFLLGLPSKPPMIAGFQGNATAVDYEQLILAFVSVVYEAMPFIVLGVIVAGLLEEFVPQQAIAKIVPRNRFLAILIGALLGLVFPMCECGIIVVMKRLLRKGLPLSVCIAYMLAGPVINLIVMTSTFVAFNPPQESDYILGGPWMVVAWRIGLSYIIAITTAVLVDWQWNKHGKRLLHASVSRGLDKPIPDDEPGAAKRSWGESLNNVTQTALHDYVDIMAFLILGACLAVGGKLLLTQTNVQGLFQENPAIAILLMMGIAILFCLCSEADAFVAANFPLFWPPASKMAFLVLGPMLDLKLYLMYTRVFRTRLIFTIIASVVAQVFVYTMILHANSDWKVPTSTQGALLAPNDVHLSSIAMGPDIWGQVGIVGAAYNPPPTAKGIPVDFKTLEGIAGESDTRKYYKDQIVEVRGQYAPYQGSEHIFQLARLKMSCCNSDAVTLFVPMISREPIKGFKHGDWVKVTGKIEFREHGGRYDTIVRISKGTDSKESDVVRCDPDPNPYIK